MYFLFSESYIAPLHVILSVLRSDISKVHAAVKNDFFFPGFSGID